MENRETNAVPAVEDPFHEPVLPSIQQPGTEFTPVKKPPISRNVIFGVGAIVTTSVVAIIVAVVLVVVLRQDTTAVCVGSTSAGCTSTLSQNLQDIASGCEQDVGICSGDTCEDCSDYCCGAVFQTMTATCGGEQVLFTKVTGCTCQLCSNFQLSISGRIVGDCTSGSSCEVSIQSNGVELTRSNAQGFYTFPITYPSSGNVVVSAVDDVSRTYLTQVLTVPVSRDAQTYVNNDIRVTTKAVPVVFDAAAGTQVDLGSSNAVALTFMPNTVETQDGTTYTGMASASVTYIDPAMDSDVDRISGELRTSVGDEVGLLSSTGGMFTVEVTDGAGSPLNAKGVMVSFTSTDEDVANTSLWYLNELTGSFDQMSSLQTSSPTGNRQKRQTGNSSATSTIDVSSIPRVINLDQLIYPYCYMKVRLFSGSELTTTSQARGIGIKSVYRRASGHWAGFIKTEVYSSGACVPVPCNRRSWRAIEVVHAEATGYHAHDPQVSSATRMRLNYAIATNAFQITIPTSGEIVEGSTGPFYTYRRQCRSANIDESYFRFTRNTTGTNLANSVNTTTVPSVDGSTDSNSSSSIVSEAVTGATPSTSNITMALGVDGGSTDGNLTSSTATGVYDTVNGTDPTSTPWNSVNSSHVDSTVTGIEPPSTGFTGTMSYTDSVSIGAAPTDDSSATMNVNPGSANYDNSTEVTPPAN